MTWIILALAYSRALFGSWQDVDHNCQDTRAEILISRSLVPVMFTDSRHCYVSRGLWINEYTFELERDASKLQIDHIVPLAEAWRSGADQWDGDRRRAFANDPQELAISSRHDNASKQDSLPYEWAPANEAARCLYFVRWKAIKHAYSLSLTNAEEQVLESCQ